MKMHIVFVSLLAFLACQQAEPVANNGLVGKWKLVEYLSDPGDGSGKWQAADEQNPTIIEFKTNGDYTSSANDDFIRYELKADQQTLEMFFNPKTNRSTSRNWFIESISATNLQLSYRCREPCGGRYIAVK